MMLLYYSLEWWSNFPSAEHAHQCFVCFLVVLYHMITRQLTLLRNPSLTPHMFQHVLGPIEEATFDPFKTDSWPHVLRVLSSHECSEGRIWSWGITANFEFWFNRFSYVFMLGLFVPSTVPFQMKDFIALDLALLNHNTTYCGSILEAWVRWVRILFRRSEKAKIVQLLERRRYSFGVTLLLMLLGEVTIAVNSQLVTGTSTHWTQFSSYFSFVFFNLSRLLMSCE